MKDFAQIIEQSRASIEKDDLRILLPLIEQVKPKSILEIGMHQGYSMELWRKAFNPIILHGMELNAPTPESYTDEPGMMWNQDSHNSFPFGEAIVKYDFLFIDGDHSYDGVKKDFEMYAPLVNKGGIIAFHDALYHHDGTEEVDLYWDYRFRKKYPYVEIKANNNSTGIGVIWV